jgi:alkylation response protein AidB-like acyl-CoA dehydrogenase
MEDWEDTLVELAITNAAYATGAAQAALAMSVSYANDRVQFGRAIGSFQAIQHLCADALMDTDKAQYLTYQAAWRREAGAPARFEAGMAALKAYTAFSDTAQTMHQIHGAIGFTNEHPAQLYSRASKLVEVLYGDADYWSDVVVAAMETMAV